MNDIVLINPPFGYGYLPSITLSNMKPLLENHNIETAIYYANLPLKKVESNTYEDLCMRFKLLQYAEFIFAPYAFPEAEAKHREYYEMVESEDSELHEEIAVITGEIKAYLEHVSEHIAGQQPSIIFLECDFKQVTASIAIANEVKKRLPSTTVVIGGCCTLGSMGDELARITPAVDYIMKGTNEFAFLELAKAVLTGEAEQKYAKLIDCPPPANLDELPFPDYDDYFEQRAAQGFEPAGSIPFESSRGCWWGAGSHCIFCGHEDKHLTYYQKSAARTLEELNYLIDRYSPRNILVKDAIMPKGFIHAVFDKLILPESMRKIFYEVKPNLSYEEIEILVGKKMKLQVGLESLNSHILKVLKKGLTAARNITFLKHCRKAGLNIHWNFLYAVPGETEEDYLDMLENVLPYITHLQPPGDVRKPVIQRFSPLYEQAASFGVKNLRPKEVYRYIFPDSADLQKLALYFDGEYETAFDSNRQLGESFLTALENWRQSWRREEPPQLKLVKEDDNSLKIVDTRREGAAKIYEVTEKHVEILEMLDRERVTSPIDNKEFDELIMNKVAIYINNRYISLL